MTPDAPQALSLEKGAQLAAIFAVPPDGVVFFHKRLLRIIEHIERIRKVDDRQFRGSDVADPLDQIAKLTNALRNALIKIPAEAHLYLEWQFLRDYPERSDVDQIDATRRQLAELGLIAARAARKVRSALPPEGASVEHRGRIKGHSRGLRSFVTRVVYEALSAGGRVTLGNRLETGTLIGFLEAFRPHLPLDLLPPTEGHPVSVYKRIIEEVSERCAQRSGPGT